MVREIALSEIEIMPGRNFREDIVTADLEESMAAIGLLHPIQVVPNDEEGYILNAGERRFRAAQKLGWTSISAHVLDSDNQVDIELAAIDENIVRRDLNGAALDRALSRRKELYLVKFPQTAAHVAGGHARAAGPEAERPRSFVEDTADKTGKSARTIERSVRRAERLSPLTMKAYEEGRITQSQADILAGRPWEEQDQLVDRVTGKSVGETRKIVAGDAGEEASGADENKTPMKQLEELYMFGQKIVSLLEQLSQRDGLEEEFVESVFNLRDNLNEEFDHFSQAVKAAQNFREGTAPFPEDPPF